MINKNLDAIIEARLKEQEEEQSYHKRSRLLKVKSSLEKMLKGDLSIKDQIEILREYGIAISDRAYRDFLAREFGRVYEDFLKRNGWIRKKRRKEANDW
ncbi:MAG: hypothetical protein LBU73_07690 [Helicobacteraceae bacterium]|jgi:hypothetical protein|nr:hypothetical protein [Helicobacteraceae bacterium]